MESRRKGLNCRPLRRQDFGQASQRMDWLFFLAAGDWVAYLQGKCLRYSFFPGVEVAMTEREQLEQAIATLEAQRSRLGDAAVESSLAGLRQKLDELRRTEFLSIVREEYVHG